MTGVGRGETVLCTVHYRQAVPWHDWVGDSQISGALSATLQDDSEEKRLEAANVIRSLVEDTVLMPVDGKVEIDVCGDLAGIVKIASERKNPAASKLRGYRK